MNSIISLIILLAIYYYIYTSCYDRFEEKYHYYFYIFIAVYLVILYIYHFEYGFLYAMLKNVYDTDKKPLYLHNSMNSNAELFESQYPNFNIKETLLQKQAGRCHGCSNFIMTSDLQNTKLKYKTALQNGGQNNVENIELVCGQCFEFQ